MHIGHTLHHKLVLFTRANIPVEQCSTSGYRSPTTHTRLLSVTFVCYSLLCFDLHSLSLIFVWSWLASKFPKHLSVWLELACDHLLILGQVKIIYFRSISMPSIKCDIILIQVRVSISNLFIYQKLHTNRMSTPHCRCLLILSSLNLLSFPIAYIHLLSFCQSTVLLCLKFHFLILLCFWSQSNTEWFPWIRHLSSTPFWSILNLLVIFCLW